MRLLVAHQTSGIRNEPLVSCLRSSDSDGSTKICFSIGLGPPTAGWARLLRNIHVHFLCHLKSLPLRSTQTVILREKSCYTPLITWGKTVAGGAMRRTTSFHISSSPFRTPHRYYVPTPAQKMAEDVAAFVRVPPPPPSCSVSSSQVSPASPFLLAISHSK